MRTDRDDEEATAMLAPAQMIESLPSTLSWEHSSGHHRLLGDAYLAMLRERWEGALDRFTRAGVGKRLTALAAALDETALERFLLAPETSSRLLVERSKDVPYFLSGLAAAADHDAPAGPLLSNGIVIDHESRNASRTIYNDLPCQPLTAAELDTTLDKLETALRGIEAAAPPAAELVRWITVLVVMKQPDEGDWFGSFSTERYIGRAALSNAHIAHSDVATLANGLVHEATHSFLYTLELSHPMIEDRPACEELAVVSPWSGRQLKLHSFLHACFVWFGLWRFWLRAREASIFASDSSERCLARARDGFHRVPEMSAAMDRVNPYLSGAWSAIPELVADVSRGRWDDRLAATAADGR